MHIMSFNWNSIGFGFAVACVFWMPFVAWFSSDRNKWKDLYWYEFNKNKGK